MYQIVSFMNIWDNMKVSVHVIKIINVSQATVLIILVNLFVLIQRLLVIIQKDVIVIMIHNVHLKCV